MNVVAIIQARMASERLPGKVLKTLQGHPVLWHILNRVGRCDLISQIIVATSTETTDDAVAQFAQENHVFCYRGSQDNVLERFYQAAASCNADIIVRLTADNALVDPVIIDSAVTYFQRQEDLDYLYYREGLPVGMCIEVFHYGALEKAYKETTDKECLEHVTPYLYRNPNKFKIFRHGCMGEDHSNLRWTIDTKEDFQLLQTIYSHFSESGLFGYQDVLDAYAVHEEWKRINSMIPQKAINYQGKSV